MRKVKIFKALLEVLMAENTRIVEFRDVTSSRLLDGTNASWENADTFLSVGQDEGGIPLVHYKQKPPLNRPSFALLHCCLSLEILQ